MQFLGEFYRKCPAIYKYFNKEQGIVNFLLDFYDDANETSSGI